MTVLGLGGSGHDWSSCVISEQGIVALEEERMSRSKYGLGADLIRGAARRRCLDAAGLTRADVAVACSLVPRVYTRSSRHQVVTINHHLAHAYSTFYSSGFESAAVLVADNAGSVHGEASNGALNVETVSLYDADPDGVRLIHRVAGLHQTPSGGSFNSDAGVTSNSLGDLYRAVTLELGFVHAVPGSNAVLSEDGKTMGLASYGDDRFADVFDDCVSLSGLDLTIDPLAVRRRMSDLRVPSFDDRAAVARAAQQTLERVLLGLLDQLFSATGRHRLCLAGGVALNSVANGRIVREGPFEEVHVVPAAGDNGISLGCAYYGALHLDDSLPHGAPPLRTAYLGPVSEGGFDVDLLEEFGLEEVGGGDPVDFLATRLADGALVAWVMGGAEFGPRALGHRSILSSPLSAHRRDHLNRSIKRREWFRPYAPIATAEVASRYFDLAGPSPFMLFVVPVLTEALPAITHVDSTARLQTLERTQCPELYELLVAFGRATGHEVLLNTSFNAAGEPIVETHRDAATAFLRLHLDYLYLDGVVLASTQRSGP